MLYDIIIVGGGPAGLTAAIYAQRCFAANVLILTESYGGNMAVAYKIENYPGFKSILGGKLAQKMQEQAQDLGAQILIDKVKDIKKTDSGFEVLTKSGKIYKSKTLILAYGLERRKLNVPGEKEFTGKGVSYCATCDGPLYREKTVAVVGGGNAGVTSALMLSNYVKQVYLLESQPKLSADEHWQKHLAKAKNIILILGTSITQIKGEQVIKKVLLDKEFDGSQELEIDGLFVEIGAVPKTELAQKIGVNLDKRGFIQVDANQKTSIPGVWAAGDATTGSAGFAQILTAAAEGAIAANSISQYLKK